MDEQPYTADDDENKDDDGPQSVFPDLTIGINLGTSKSSVAAWNGTRIEVLEYITNEKFMRSNVLVGSELSAGEAGEEPIRDEKEILCGNEIFNVKRLIGRVDTDPIVRGCKMVPFLVQTMDIGVRPFIAALLDNVWRTTVPEVMLSVMFQALKSLAELRLKRPIRCVVLTIPVSFSRFQHSSIVRACAMAGLYVCRLMPEPTAVALLYAQEQLRQERQRHPQGIGSRRSGDEKFALIFNMGAGYCDVAVSATGGGLSQTKAMFGCAVGGEDLLLNVAYHLVPDFDDLYPFHDTKRIRAIAALRIAAEDAIHKLSTQSSVEIDVDLGGEVKIQEVLERSKFEDINLSVFEKCEDLVRRCILDANVSPEEIHDVLLVGGCSKIPKIRNFVLAFCRKEKEFDVDALEAAVIGAAIEGAIASGINHPSGSLELLSLQSNSLSLGILVDGGAFAPIVPRNTVVPTRKEMRFTTTQDDQTEAVILVYEGDERAMEKNHLLGYVKVTAIPPAPKGSAEISVLMDIDAASTLKVFCGAVGSAEPFTETRMPMLDEGSGWVAEVLAKTQSSLGVASIPSPPTLQPEQGGDEQGGEE